MSLWDIRMPSLSMKKEKKYVLGKFICGSNIEMG